MAENPPHTAFPLQTALAAPATSFVRQRNCKYVFPQEQEAGAHQPGFHFWKVV